MILAQNPLQLLSGSKMLAFILIIVLFNSCNLFKPVSNNNNGTDSSELDEVISDKPVRNPNTKYDVDGNPIEDNGLGDEDNNNTGTTNNKPNNGTGTTNNTGKPNNGTGGTVNDPKGNIADKTKKAVAEGGLKYSYKVGILMPFFAKEVATASKMPRSSVQGMNFYEGSLLALQQLSIEGVNLDVEVFDSRRSEAIVQGLVDNFTLSSMDLIIGPASTENVEIVAEQVAKKEQVPMVTLNLNSTIATKNPYYIQASPYFESHAAATVKYIKQHYPRNKVIMVAPQNGKEVSRFQDYHNVNNSNNRYQEFFAEEMGTASYKFTGLTDLLSLRDTTIIIAPVSDDGFASALLRTLNAVKGSKPVVVFGMPSWMSFSNLEGGILENCNVHVTNSSFVNKNNEKVKLFKQAFFEEYGMFPTIEAYKGYDLTLYFGRMLNKYGTGFINHLETSKDELLQTSFDFERVFEPSDGTMGENYTIRCFENKFVHILRFKNFKYVSMNTENIFAPIKKN
jgi:ABC-type branched-subunit amino acid transport system substrate-binding protein